MLRLPLTTAVRFQLRLICFIRVIFFSLILLCTCGFANSYVLFVCLCLFSSAESVFCSLSQKVSLHLQGFRSVSDGSGRQFDGQRPQGGGHARDTLHLQVIHCSHNSAVSLRSLSVFKHLLVHIWLFKRVG